MVFRHPFPGPGLGVRILGEVKKNTPICYDRPMRFLSKSCTDRGGTTKPAKPLRFSTGKVSRCSGGRSSLRIRYRDSAVQTVDFMTARWAHLPYELLEVVSNRIINEISGISRVTYDISGKPPATIEWE